MPISRLVLQNWRNFKSLDVSLQDRVFIIGPNASGKSNLLDAIRFLRDVATPGGGLQRAVEQRGGLSKIRCLLARKEPVVCLRADLSEGPGKTRFIYEIGITQEVRGRRQPKLKYEKVWKDGKVVLERPDAADKKDDLRLTQTHLEQINANAEFREIARFFESVRYLHMVPQLVRHPEAFQGPGIPQDPYGRNFLEMVGKTPEKTQKARLGRIEKALRQAVPNLKKLTYIKDETGIPHLEAIYEHWRPNAGRQREDQFSDGTLRLMGLFWSLLDGSAPLLLEEPELSLHGEIVSKLSGLLALIQRKSGRQMFVSTHSWQLLSDEGIGGEEVVLLTPGNDGTTATVASSIDDVRQLLDAGLSVADAVLPRTAPSTLKELNLEP